MNLLFVGCGFFGVYYFGVVICLILYVLQFLKNVIVFVGVLVGLFVVVVLVILVLLDKCLDYVIEFIYEVCRYFLGFFNFQFDLVGSLRKGFEFCFFLNFYRIVLGRFFIFVISLKDRKNVILFEFDFKEDLIQVIYN